MIQLEPTQNQGPTEVDATPRWFVRTADRSQQGPMTKAVLDRLVAEGRLDESCQVRHADWDHWDAISTTYPQRVVASQSSSLAEETIGDDSTPDTLLDAGNAGARGRLQPCPDCGKQVSLRATQCPHCGCPLGAMAALPLPARAPGRPKKNNKTFVILASVGGVLLILGAVGVFLAIRAWNRVQPVLDVVEQVARPLPPVPDASKPTPEQIAACMKEAAATTARKVDQRFAQEHAAVGQLAQLQGSAEMLQSLAEGGFDSPKIEKESSASKPPAKQQPYQSQYDVLYRQCLEYLTAHDAEHASSLAAVWDMAGRWESEQRSVLEQKLLEGLSNP